MRRILLIAVTILAVPLFLTNIAEGSERQFFFNFQGKARLWYFMFPCSGARRIFLWGPTAVDIISVMCDKKIVIPEMWAIAARPNLAEGDGNGMTVVYQNNASFKSWVTIDTKVAHPEIRNFAIPEDAKDITVRYRVRFPDGTISEVYEVRFVNTRYEEYLLRLPNSQYPDANH